MEREAIAKIPLRAFEAVFGAMGKENALQGVETFVFERFEIGIELGSQQELVDEGLVTFIGKVGCDHLREEPGILFQRKKFSSWQANWEYLVRFSSSLRSGQLRMNSN